MTNADQPGPPEPESVAPTEANFGDGNTTAVPSASVDMPGPKFTAWSDVHWKPFEIGIGAFYALCLKGGFDTTIAYFRAHPTALSALDFDVSRFDKQLAIFCQLVTFVIWLSAYYFHTVRLYFRLPAEPERDRVVAFGNITVTLGLFYFLGESIGQPSKSQVVLICAILVADLLLPIQALKSVASTRMRIWWVSAALTVLTAALLLLALVPAKVMTHYWWSYLILLLICVNFLLVRPLAAKRRYLPR